MPAGASPPLPPSTPPVPRSIPQSMLSAGAAASPPLPLADAEFAGGAVRSSRTCATRNEAAQQAESGQRKGKKRAAGTCRPQARSAFEFCGISAAQFWLRGLKCGVALHGRKGRAARSEVWGCAAAGSVGLRCTVGRVALHVGAASFNCSGVACGECMCDKVGCGMYV
eukprot:357937-Chlamydomonas_euryale.AAC.8